MTLKTFAATIALTSLVAAPALAIRKSDQEALAAGTPTGKPVGCIQRSQIQNTRVRDDRTIDFVMRGRNQVYRNTLPYSCPQLGFEQAFSYETSIGQLCNVDIITVVHTGGGPVRGASCGLGQFTPIDLPRKYR